MNECVLQGGEDDRVGSVTGASVQQKNGAASPALEVVVYPPPGFLPHGSGADMLAGDHTVDAGNFGDDDILLTGTSVPWHSLPLLQRAHVTL